MLMFSVYNEIEYAEKMIKDGFQTRRKLYELSLLAKYYYYKGKSKNEVFKLINEFCEEHMENFNKVLYFDKIMNITNTAKNSSIKSIDSISINRTDMNVLDELESVELKKLTLCIIVLSKIKMITTGGRYINNKYSKLSSISNLKSGCKIREMLLVLVNKGIINICINGSIIYLRDIDNSKDVFAVKDFNNIGYYMMNYLSHRYIECEDCGAMMKRKNNSHKYCTACARLRYLKSKMEYYKKNENPGKSETDFSRQQIQ